MTKARVAKKNIHVICGRCGGPVLKGQTYYRRTPPVKRGHIVGAKFDHKRCPK